MRSLLTVSMIAALALVGVAAYASTSTADGLSWNPDTGGTGYFSNPAAAYPGALASRVSDGWNVEDDPLATYVSYKGGFSLSGIYDYDDYKWITTGGPSPEETNLTVICDVEMWVRETLGANEVYFHLGNQNAVPMNAYLGGTLQSNNGQYVGLASSKWGSGNKAKADNLVFLADGFGRTKAWFETNQPTNVPPDIPIAYALDQGSGYTAGSWSGGNNNQDWGYWWLIGGGQEGSFSYTFRLAIAPKSYQEDGRYYLDPDVVVMPAL